MVDDVKFTVSHVVEPMERGIARINETFHQISANVKQFEKRKRKAKDDSFLIPLESRSEEFSEAYDQLPEGSISDSGVTKKRYQNTRTIPSAIRKSDSSSPLFFEFTGGRWS